jgi:hypothetical protein
MRIRVWTNQPVAHPLRGRYAEGCLTDPWTVAIQSLTAALPPCHSMAGLTRRRHLDLSLLDEQIVSIFLDGGQKMGNPCSQIGVAAGSRDR